MKKFKFSMFASSASVAIMLLVTTSCRNEKSELVPTGVEKQQSGIETAKQLAQNAVKPNMHQQYETMDKAYKALTFEELEAFNKEVIRISLEKTLQKDLSNGRSNAVQKAEAENEAKNDEIYKNAVNQAAMKQFGVSYNKLTTAQLNIILSKIVAPSLGGSTVERTTAACNTASFPYVTSKTDNAPQNHYGWTRRATPSAPNDCDYEFSYSGTHSRISADNFLSWQLCSYWGFKIARRYISGGTALLYGNNGILLFTGYDNYDVNML
jgi:hypothetical protein